MATVAPSANDLTRQQLDELDALLQRMLSLPLNPPESFAPNPPAAAFAPPLPAPLPAPVPLAREVPTPAPAPRLFSQPTSPPETRPAPEPSPVATPWKDFAPAHETVLEPPRPVIVPTPRIEKPRPVPELAQSLPVAVETVPAYVPPRPEPVPFLLVPLVGFNAALNWALGLFGLPGRVLRSGFIKTLFGLAGLGLLIYTGLKVAQIHGLVTLPVPLPWPR